MPTTDIMMLVYTGTMRITIMSDLGYTDAITILVYQLLVSELGSSSPPYDP